MAELQRLQAALPADHSARLALCALWRGPAHAAGALNAPDADVAAAAAAAASPASGAPLPGRALPEGPAAGRGDAREAREARRRRLLGGYGARVRGQLVPDLRTWLPAPERDPQEEERAWSALRDPGSQRWLEGLVGEEGAQARELSGAELQGVVRHCALVGVMADPAVAVTRCAPPPPWLVRLSSEAACECKTLLRGDFEGVSLWACVGGLRCAGTSRRRWRRGCGPSWRWPTTRACPTPPWCWWPGAWCSRACVCSSSPLFPAASAGKASPCDGRVQLVDALGMVWCVGMCARVQGADAAAAGRAGGGQLPGRRGAAAAGPAPAPAGRHVGLHLRLPALQVRARLRAFAWGVHVGVNAHACFVTWAGDLSPRRAWGELAVRALSGLAERSSERATAACAAGAAVLAQAGGAGEPAGAGAGDGQGQQAGGAPQGGDAGRHARCARPGAAAAA